MLQCGTITCAEQSHLTAATHRLGRVHAGNRGMRLVAALPLCRCGYGLLTHTGAVTAIMTMTKTTILGPQGELSVVHGGADRAARTLPILFLHADSGRAAQWDPVLRGVARERRVAAFDFPGCGESASARDHDYGFVARATAVESVVNALELSRFVLVGHSGGAAVALEYAARHAPRVAGLLLVEPPTDPRALPKAVRAGFVRDLTGPRSLQAQQEFYRSIAGANAAVRERVLADCVPVAEEARAGFGAALASWDPEPALNAWRGPFLILSVAANDNEHALYRLRSDVPHRVVPSAGHWLQLEQPELVQEAIVDFVRPIEARSP